VLDQDYLTVPEEQIKDIKVVLTLVGGKVVYASPEYAAN
jgi:predicted amidohydrolase YtcJ